MEGETLRAAMSASAWKPGGSPANFEWYKKVDKA
jgi:hypothetical protein